MLLYRSNCKYSAAAQFAAEYAVSEINENGGIRGVPVELEIYDTAFETEIGYHCHEPGGRFRARCYWTA